MTTETASILSKIKKLQALTTDRGATPEEAAAAAAKAQALLFEHNLAQADVETANPGSAPDPYGKVEHHHEEANRTTITWRRTLLHVIAKNSFCSTVFHPGTTKQSVIGKRSNVESVLYLNDCISRQIEELATRAAKTQLSDRAAYKNSFSLGAVSTIGTRLAEQRRMSEHTATQSGTTQADADRGNRNAVILRDSAQALQTTVSKFFPRLRTGSAGRVRNSDAYHAGRAAGSNVSMHRGVGTRTTGLLG